LATSFPAPPRLDGPIGIVGLGLIGGSLGLDLQARDLEVRALVHRQATADRARQRGLASVVGLDPSILQGCALVVLALPLDRLLAPEPALLAAIPAQAVVTDVGSVKAPVLARWSGLHPRFVAGHPMAGTASAGVEAGQRGLFAGRPWVLTPTPHTDPAALDQLFGLAAAVEARALVCDAADHDRAVALISHLPVLVSAALLQGVDGCARQQGDALPELVRALASSGFADTTRVGGGNPELGTLMARCNREALQTALAAYRRSLGQLEHCLAEERWPALQEALRTSQGLRPEFL
jgi:arogenate dehydrogenase (NADP+)